MTHPAPVPTVEPENDPNLLGYVIVDWYENGPDLDHVGLYPHRAAAEQACDELRGTVRDCRWAVCEVRLIDGTQPR